MSIRIFRKALGLLLVDIIAIIGIFVLQFRTDSNIIEKIGNLQVTLSKKETPDNLNLDENTENNRVNLMNKFSVSYNGIKLYSDEKNPIFVIGESEEPRELVLESWVKKDNLSCLLNFSDGITLSFELASNEPGASLAVITELPDGYDKIVIPYSFASNMNVEKEDDNSVVLNKRKEVWEIKASNLSDGKIIINSSDFVATYSIYEEVKEFSFDVLGSLPIAEMSVFTNNLEIFSNTLISAFESNPSDAGISEQVVVSYIAAMAAQGNYTEAIDKIPTSIKKSSHRTYLSAPYFNTLESKNKLLDESIYSYEQKISDSAASGSMDIFTIHNIANYMSIHSNPSVVKTLLKNTAQIDASKLSLAQATGIIQVFVDLYSLRSDYANMLYPVVEGCINRIASACVFDGSVLTISENDTFLSVIQAIETGIAIMRYGITMNDIILQKAGCVIVNSYLKESSSFDLRTLANLYPLMAFDNTFYPHFKKLDELEDGKLIWAWTCATDIIYERDANGSAEIIIDFPEDATHHVIVKGLPKFDAIYIYGMQFRTDSRFETYNSSGYVYKDKFETLLLKSRHKQQLEHIRFEYN